MSSDAKIDVGLRFETVEGGCDELCFVCGGECFLKFVRAVVYVVNDPRDNPQTAFVMCQSCGAAVREA